MDDLTQEDAFHLRAAGGWLELGLPIDAFAEIKGIPKSRHRHPIVLMVLWRLHAHSQQWRKCVEIADELVQVDPNEASGWIHRSYALHELKQTKEAADLLEPALARFPNEELIPYNLACYACQLGKLNEAKALLVLAFRRGSAKEIRQRALEDSDLVPMRDYLSSLEV